MHVFTSKPPNRHFFPYNFRYICTQTSVHPTCITVQGELKFSTLCCRWLRETPLARAFETQHKCGRVAFLADA